jgi:hypothetical protein
VVDCTFRAQEHDRKRLIADAVPDRGVDSG